MSGREYARHRGCSHVAVIKAIQSGRITAEGGLVDPEVADREWEANTDPTRKPKKARSASAVAAIPGRVPPFVESRAKRESYLADLAQLQFKERRGKLVSADDVRIAAFNAVRGARDMLLAIPDRLAPIIAAQTDAREVHAMLLGEIRRVCDELSNAKFAGSAD